MHLENVHVNYKIADYPISFERRRYGKTWYCWALVFVRGTWKSLGDPWQSFQPKKTEVETAVNNYLKRREGK